jgi:hypothetical protein
MIAAISNVVATGRKMNGREGLIPQPYSDRLGAAGAQLN